jgi:hypothetical protein
MITDNSTKNCAVCGCDLTATPPSTFDPKYCTFCQNERTGSFEDTHFKIALKFIINEILIGMNRIKPDAAQRIGVALIKQNPLIIRKAGCTN